MEDILAELKTAIVERFKINACVDKYERLMKDNICALMLEAHKGIIICRGGIKYELFEVVAHVYSSSYDIVPHDFRIDLIYTIASKINSAQKEALMKAKQEFPINRSMGWYNGRKKLWIIESYELSPVEAASGFTNLSIKKEK